MDLRIKAAWLTGLLFLVFTAALFLPPSVNGQAGQSGIPQERLLRVEIPAKTDDETYRLIPMGQTGVMLFFKSLEVAEQDKIKWYFTFYDQDLQKVWSKSIALPGSLEFRKYSVDYDTAGLVFATSEKAKTSKPVLEIIRVHSDDGHFTGNDADIPDNGEIAGFILKNGKALVGMNVKNGPAKLLIFNLQNGDKKTIALTEPLISSFSEMATDSTGTSICVSARSSSARTLAEYLLSVFDTSGMLLIKHVVTSGNPEYELLSMKFLALDRENILVAGTYGAPQNQKSLSRNPLPPEATGFFFTSVKQNQVQPIVFCNFLEFRNIGSIVGEKDIQAIKKRSEKKNKEIKEYSVDLTLLLHPLRLSGNQVILRAEAFYPQYHTENFTDYDFYGRPFTNTYNVFDGYRYSKSIIAGFDHSGKLLWDNSAEIRNLISFDLAPKVIDFDSRSGKVLAYLSDGKIGSKIINGNDVVEKLDFSPVEMTYPNDKLISETRSMLVSWYENFFLCYGYQEIKNVSLEKNNKRLVFYFNKIRFE